MARTSSFKIEYTNYICYNPLLKEYNSNDSICTIEIPKDKQFFNKHTIDGWLNDLMSIGLSISNYTYNKDESYTITLKTAIYKAEWIMTLMLIRCLWEGKYLQQYGDLFYHVIEGYVKIQKLDLGYTILENIGLAVNYFWVVNKGYSNSNHILSTSYGCRLFKTLPKFDYASSINDIFSCLDPEGNKHDTFKKIYYSNIQDLNTKEEFHKLYETIQKIST